MYMADGFFRTDELPLPKSQLKVAVADAEERLVNVMLSGEHPPVLFMLKSAETCAFKIKAGTKQKNRTSSVRKERVENICFKGSSSFGLPVVSSKH